jgi:hypothetical protein
MIASNPQTYKTMPVTSYSPNEKDEDGVEQSFHLIVK